MLNEEIASAQRSVRTDAYQMSIGEVVSMYENGEIVIDPEFQRLFRWEISQKSKLIESLLLGIPLPPIFVFEREDGTWELIDGLQRLSTLLEFMGLLKGSDGVLVPPSVLEATRYLPSLHNAVWEKSAAISQVAEDEQSQLETSHRLAIRRSRIGVEILKRPSDNQTKYDLFQRLNAGGTAANYQELRNCIILMVNPEYFGSIKSVAESQNFTTVLRLNDDQIQKQRHLEFATRLLVHTKIEYDGKLDVEEYIDEGAVSLANEGDVGPDVNLIVDTLDILDQAFGDDALRRYENGAFVGRVTLTGFEVVAVGVARNLGGIRGRQDPIEFVRQKVREFWAQPEVAEMTTPGLRGTVRIKRTVPFGQDWFANE